MESVVELAAQGHSLPPAIIDDGSDVDESMGEDEGDIDSKVTAMWTQFLVDMLLKTPNARRASGASSLKATAQQRLLAREDFYRNTNLSDMWNYVSYKVGDQDAFDLAFSHLFPIPEYETPASTQNYGQCRYYTTWKEICVTADRSAVNAIREAIRKLFSRLLWIPHACSDKMWPTKVVRGFTRLPPGSTGAAPRILIRSIPTWSASDDNDSGMNRTQ
jgi:hypothetical protein